MGQISSFEALKCNDIGHLNVEAEALRFFDTHTNKQKNPDPTFPPHT